ncbi:hypothetical protein FSP39_007258 [Pinctada imbricata]|uniref:SAM domain-containing protein n=1 Tax=Pinctada imbricata TaxID=66713 RepID=A0AA89BLZ4_PINIB|nr:hypothetical protein FSP39_007258 [Pinctada imbricata]
MSTTNTRDVTFENAREAMTVAQFYGKYHESLPRIIVVTQGYCGDIGLETFSIGQVLRIHTYSSQKRVVANIQKGVSTLDGRDISIPLGYNIKFHVKGQKKGKDQSLEEIIDKNPLPVTVIPSALGTLHFGDKDRAVGEQCELKLIKTYEDRYLLGNAVSDGMLYAHVTAVPVYLPDLKLSLAIGVKEFTKEQWIGCQNNMAELVKGNVKFQKDFGNPNIAVYSTAKPAKTESDYEFTYRVPVEYYNLEDILQHRDNRQSKPIYTTLTEQTYAFIPADYESLNVPKRIMQADKKQDKHEEDDSSSASGQSFGSDGGGPTRPSVDVSKLSVNELAYWMKELKLEKYISPFTEQMMDGVLLQECNKNDLVSSFSMSAFEAVKLMKFAKSGHVPR